MATGTAVRTRSQTRAAPDYKQEVKPVNPFNERRIESLPYLQYKGQIKYLTTFMDIAEACDEILSAIEQSSDFLVMGFDMEWPFNFQTGSGKTAVIQISTDLEMAYVFHVSAVKKLPAGVNHILAHPKSRLTGVNVKNDVRKLSRDFPAIEVEKMIANCIDSGVLSNQILPITQRWSMERLVIYLLAKRISKDKKVRMSKWHIIPLSTEQLKYAATDAYASLLLYHTLESKKNQLTL